MPTEYMIRYLHLGFPYIFFNPVRYVRKEPFFFLECKVFEASYSTLEDHSSVTEYMKDYTSAEKYHAYRFYNSRSN